MLVPQGAAAVCALCRCRCRCCLRVLLRQVFGHLRLEIRVLAPLAGAAGCSAAARCCLLKLCRYLGRNLILSWLLSGAHVDVIWCDVCCMMLYVLFPNQRELCGAGFQFRNVCFGVCLPRVYGPVCWCECKVPHRVLPNVYGRHYAWVSPQAAAARLPTNISSSISFIRIQSYQTSEATTGSSWIPRGSTSSPRRFIGANTRTPRLV